MKAKRSSRRDPGQSLLKHKAQHKVGSHNELTFFMKCVRESTNKNVITFRSFQKSCFQDNKLLKVFKFKNPKKFQIIFMSIRAVISHK